MPKAKPPDALFASVIGKPGSTAAACKDNDNKSTTASLSLPAGLAATGTLATLRAAGGGGNFRYDLTGAPDYVRISEEGLLIMRGTSSADATTLAMTAQARGAFARNASFAAAEEIALAVVDLLSLSLHAVSAVDPGLAAAGRVLTLATISASGGFAFGNVYSLAVSANEGFTAALPPLDIGGFALAVSASAAGIITAIVYLDDSHPQTSPVSALFTLAAADALRVIPPPPITITTYLPLADDVSVRAVGGVGSVRFALSSALLGVDSLSGLLSLAGDAPTITQVQTAQVFAVDSSSPPLSARLSLTINIVNPPSITILLVNPQLNVLEGDSTLGVISVIGGYTPDSYSVSLAFDGLNAQLGIMSATLTMRGRPALITATLTADDRHNNTAPASLFLTVRILEGFTLSVAEVVVPVSVKASNVVLATLQPGGVSGPYTIFIDAPPFLKLSGDVLLLSGTTPDEVGLFSLVATAASETTVLATALVFVVDAPIFVTVVGRDDYFHAEQQSTIGIIAAQGGFVFADSSLRYGLDSRTLAAGLDSQQAITISAAEGEYKLTLSVSDDSSRVAALLIITANALEELSLLVSSALTVTSYSSPPGIYMSISAFGGGGDFTFSIADSGGLFGFGDVANPRSVLVSNARLVPLLLTTDISAALTTTAELHLHHSADLFLQPATTFFTLVVNEPPSLTVSFGEGREVISSLIRT